MQLISIGQLIDQTWEQYRAKFRDLVGISAWMLVPSIFSVIALAIYPGAISLITNRPVGALDIVAMAIWILANQIALPIVGLWTFIATIKFLNAQKDSGRVDLKKISKESWKDFFPVVWVNILVGLIIFAAVLILAPGFIINALGAHFDSMLVAKIGGVILFFSAFVAAYFIIKFTVRYAFAPLSMIVDRVRGVKALKHSHELTKGNIINILLLRIFAALVFGVIIFAIVAVGNFAVSFIVSYLAGLNAELLAKLDTIQAVVSSTITLVVFYPIFYVLEFTLFDSLRKNK